MSTRMLEILKVITGHIETKGYGPTIREIMTATGITSSAHVRYYLLQLEKQKLIQRGEKGKARTITLVKQDSPV